jgi:hypothetical protein
MNESTHAGRAKREDGKGGGTVWPFLSALFKVRIIRGTGEREAGVLK